MNEPFKVIKSSSSTKILDIEMGAGTTVATILLVRNRRSNEQDLPDKVSM